ncbi:otefin [Anopheles aquasalis]|uniref:otefin n=1 Tax=Anopheles aquasalis TaxID=42839 RepID=UPI00215A2434|nr:otefin [Anopheles aquasalis]
MEVNLDELTNDELRVQLLKHGMANLPVTSTTRKVLLKKLKNHLETNAGTGTPTKGRRETINIARYSSDEDGNESVNTVAKKTPAKKEAANNRRATFAGAAPKPAKPIPVPVQPAAKKLPDVTVTADMEPEVGSKRKSGRITPLKGRMGSDSARSSTPAKINSAEVAALLEDSDDDMMLLSQLSRRDRKSKSPSLTRADTVTTSYINQQGRMGSTPAKLNSAEVAAFLEDADEDMIPLTQLSRRDRKSKSPSLTRADMVTTSYIHQQISQQPPILEEMEVDTEKSELETIVLDDDVEIVEAPFQLPAASAAPSVVKEALYNRTTSATVAGGSHRTYESAAARRTPTEDPYSDLAHFKPRSTSSVSGTMASTRPTPNITSSTYRTTTATVRDDPPFNPSDSPYLSEFTKRLSRLRAETVQLGDGGGSRESPSRRTTMHMGDPELVKMRLRYPEEAKPTRFSTVATTNTAGGKNIRASARQSLLALDQKYAIKKIFYTIMVLLVVIFLFVFFFL